ncbi:MAG: GTP cyclohydrolase I FolE [Bacteroidia bacterium]|nr:GTP cyclohydrolase I FolE [Bacteroidia bacterium]MDW8345578.1 GTP cyclohydrolase I FolE [Bacteroidia bacterium]
MTKILNGKSQQSEVEIEFIGDNHLSANMDTPLKPDAFSLTDEVKVALIEQKFREIMDILGLDLNDDSLSGTPHRVAKMYVKEIFSGLNPKNTPKISLFENKYQYNQMLVEKNITVFSHCEHHFVPILGKAHVGYISSGKVIGLSKLNRIVDYFAKRPQVQERLTCQIANYLSEVLETEDIAVVIDAKHLCVATRGIKDTTSSTVTSIFKGRFQQNEVKKEFLQYLEFKTEAF